MKKITRNKVFETNSSSTHTMTVCLEEEWNEFEKGNRLIDWNGTLYTIEEAVKKVKRWNSDFGNGLSREEIIKELEDTEEFYTYDNWNDHQSERLENDYEIYVTPSGEKVRIECWYGYEG